jgi:hypothetical protein
MLLGIRESGGGLGNNADEIETATRLFDNIVIRPYQLEIIEAIDEILSINGIALNLYFKTIQPLDFIDVNTMNAETNEEETGVKMSNTDNFYGRGCNMKKTRKKVGNYQKPKEENKKKLELFLSKYGK